MSKATLAEAVMEMRRPVNRGKPLIYLLRRMSYKEQRVTQLRAFPDVSGAEIDRIVWMSNSAAANIYSKEHAAPIIADSTYLESYGGHF